MIIIVSIILAFLCGSVPTGYLITKKLYGIDIRTKGSGNIGSTNVKRIAGTKASILTQIGDILKGIIPIILGIVIFRNITLLISKDIYLSLLALAVILGHNYTPFLGFRGGKGVNTTLGAFILLIPVPTLTGVAVYFLLKLFTSIVSIRSMVLGITIFIASIIMKSPLPIVVSTAMAAILIIFRHKDNIKRIINKEEK
ncbi:glycerol-3-phosphate 1-O-acyltransferase PlsY [Desnuesiella massiliensis]|uniref:glycerol-3-phosphate 1-O-acyltransferase PlsY n=1 Tax=Desnuesiella massiliensis TaxID=1650662 RepID=UPI0006E1B4B7|nr:glycerol-3-phosphate 1-O-acyltransferase PlsY [Desnuesiella massiliensis]